VLGVGGTGSLSSVVSLSGGALHSLARLDDGTVVAWGDNAQGQLGTGDLGTAHSTPVKVLGVGGVGYLEPVSQVAGAVSGHFTLALTSTYQALDLTVRAGGLSRVLFQAPGADTDSLRILRLSAEGRAADVVATFDPPSGAPVAKRMVRGADGTLYLLFTDSLTAPTQYALASVPEAGGTVVRSAATPLADAAIDLGEVPGYGLYLLHGGSAIGDSAHLDHVSGFVEGGTLGFSDSGVLLNPSTSMTDGYRALGLVMLGAECRALYQTHSAGVPNGWTVAHYVRWSATDAVTSTVTTAGLPLRLCVASSGANVVLSASGRLGSTQWTVSTVPMTVHWVEPSLPPPARPPPEAAAPAWGSFSPSA
jgi:hypothetical protein